MHIEKSIQDIIAAVDNLNKDETKYAATLKALKKASIVGDISQILKHKSAAIEAMRQLNSHMAEIPNLWQFDTKAYLETETWKNELCAELDRLGVRYMDGEANNLLVPPNNVSTAPVNNRLIINKKPWTKLRPIEVAKYLKSLASASSSERSLQVFLNSLYRGSKASTQSDNWIKLNDLYNHFCDAPGWEADNPRQSFSQQLYNLNKVGHLRTKDDKNIHFEGPTGKAKNSELFSVVADDGRSIIYYAVFFK